MSANFPSLVLDCIFCHLIGDTESQEYCPDDWSACLRVTSTTKVPGFVRRLLSQCPSFSALESGDTPSLPLLQTWFTSFSLLELTFDGSGPLSASFIRRRDFGAVVTTEMVDAASTAGVHMLDIVWQMHCHLLRLPPMDFPHTTKAIDSAQDVDTLKWWWQKHVQFGLPFKHAEAVHGAIAGRVARETVPDPVQPKAHWLATVKEDRPTQLAMCQWWRDRATIDGLVHFHKTDDAENHLNNEGDAALRSIEFDDLGTLAVDGRVDLLEAWAAMVDSALLPPITEPTDFFSDDQTLPDPPALSWWWRRHVDHGLPFPDVADLLVSASENGRIDTLDWIWNSSLPAASTPSARLVPLVAPDLFYITRDTRHTVLPWWLERADRDPSFKLPMLSWSWDDRDTLEDLQAFWNLQTRGQQSGNEGLRDINDHYFPYHHFPCHQDQRPAVDAVVARSS